mgnify:CR=1 FL=1
MKLRLRRFIIRVGRILNLLGFNPLRMASLVHFPLYWRQKKEWLKQGGTIDTNYPILIDYSDSAGNAKGHYFNQDLLVANLIFKSNPVRHVDVGSRVDGFVANVASFREIEVADIRPLDESVHANIKFFQLDLMDSNNLEKTDSLSCLHAIEHFGLGRYTDPVDVNGHIKGINNLVALVEDDGHLYLSVPIGQRDEVHFNAHRVFHPQSVLAIPSIKENMELIRYDFVDDGGTLHLDRAVQDSVGSFQYGCGIYTFKKVNTSSIDSGSS